MNRICILFTVTDSVVAIINLLKAMTIRKILGEQGPMAQMCNGGSCPAVILTDGDAAYVQGYKLWEGERAQLSSPDAEDFVRIPLAVLKKIAAQVLDA